MMEYARLIAEAIGWVVMTVSGACALVWVVCWPFDWMFYKLQAATAFMQWLSDKRRKERQRKEGKPT